MTHRIKMIWLSLISLSLGGIIYIFSRPNVYISKIIIDMLNIGEDCSFVPPVISFYVPDFLWASALCSGLFAAYPLRTKNGWIWGAVTTLYGIVWEILQFFMIVSGTADIVDVLLYLTAAVVVVMINFYLEMRKKE